MSDQLNAPSPDAKTRKLEDGILREEPPVKRYVHKPEKMLKISPFYGPNHEKQYVHGKDYDAAQSELAALREELAKTEENRRILSSAYLQLLERLGNKDMSHSEALKSISATEQRNAALVKLLMFGVEAVDALEIFEGKTNEDVWVYLDNFRLRVGDALKPTESGSSE